MPVPNCAHCNDESPLLLGTVDNLRQVLRPAFMFVFTYYSICLRQIAHTAINIRFILKLWYVQHFFLYNFVLNKAFLKAKDCLILSTSLGCISWPNYCHFLACIINKTIDTGLFPSQWKMAKVFPLYKKDDRTDAQNYRPISVLPAISKICERVVYNQLYRYLNSNGLLTKKPVWISFPSLYSDSAVTFNK